MSTYFKLQKQKKNSNFKITKYIPFYLQGYHWCHFHTERWANSILGPDNLSVYPILHLEQQSKFNLNTRNTKQVRPLLSDSRGLPGTYRCLFLFKTHILWGFWKVKIIKGSLLNLNWSRRSWIQITDNELWLLASESSSKSLNQC